MWTEGCRHPHSLTSTHCMLYYIAMLICNIYHMVGRSIADISLTRGTIFTEARSTKVGYRGYGPPYHTIYDILYGECTADKPFCVRRLNIFEKTPLFTWRLL